MEKLVQQFHAPDVLLAILRTKRHIKLHWHKQVLW